MSVLVRDMKIPKNCMDCPLFESLYHYHGCHAKPESFNDRDMWNFAVGDRPSWCSLAEVPAPHGRLIDADAFAKDECNSCDGACESLPCDCLNCEADCRCDFMKDIADAPTVIEAEDGES